MNEFNPLNLWAYTPAEMLEFIISGQVTKEAAYECGYPAIKRPELERLIREWEAQNQSQQLQNGQFNNIHTIH